jgi:hypothetical protein
MIMSQPDSPEDYLVHYFDIARYKLIYILSISIFMVLFLLAFQPFGVNNFDPGFHISLEFLLIVTVFGLVVAASLTINEFLLRPLLIRKLTRPKLIGWLAWTYLLIATVVFLFYNFIGNWHDLRWSSYFEFILDLGMLFSIPLAGFIFFIRHESLKSEYVQLQSIHLAGPGSKLIHISSDNGKDKISVAMDMLLYLESQDNYVAVVYLDKDQRRAVLIRSSLKRLGASIDEPSLIRCHRSFMVNLARVRSCHGNRHGLRLGVDGADNSIPVSRAYTESILQKLGPQQEKPKCQI